MGLMDRDYMHDQRAERAFAPTPEKSALNSFLIVLMFVAALFVLFKLAAWHLAQRSNTFATESINSSPPASNQAPGRYEALPEARPQPASPRSYQQVPESEAGHRVITKCIVNGKTSYGDGPCASGAVAAQVTTRPDQNIMAPVRAFASARPEIPFSPVPVVVAQNTAPSDYAAKKLECQSLDARVQHLDSMSRQPQSGQMMDWIGVERKKARDQQFRIPCR